MALRRRRKGEAHLEQKLFALQADLEQIQEDLRGLVRAGGEFGVDRVADMFDDAQAAAGRAGSRVGDWANDNLVSVRSSVRAQPLAAIFMSMGAAALLGAFLFRR